MSCNLRLTHRLLYRRKMQSFSYDPDFPVPSLKVYACNPGAPPAPAFRVAVKELSLSYHYGDIANNRVSL